MPGQRVPTIAPPQSFWHQCEKCPRSLPARKGLYNHQQWHLREEAKQARQNVAAGAPPRQPPTSATGSTSPHQQASPGRVATPGTSSVVAPSPLQSGTGSSPGETDQQQQATASSAQSAAAGPSSQEVLPTPPPSGVEDLAGGPADHQAARPSSPSDEYCSPAEGELSGQTARRAIGSPPPSSPEAMTRRRVDRHSGSTYGTQEEVADTAGPESTWVLAEMTAELRALSRLPVSEENWAWFEAILDRAEAAITDHLRLSRHRPLLALRGRQERPDIHVIIRCPRGARRAGPPGLGPLSGALRLRPPPPGVPQVARAVRWRWDPVRGPRCPSSRHPPTHWRTGRPRRERHRSQQNWFAPHPLLPQQAVVATDWAARGNPGGGGGGGGTKSDSRYWVPAETRRRSAPRRAASAYLPRGKEANLFRASGKAFKEVGLCLVCQIWLRNHALGAVEAAVGRDSNGQIGDAGLSKELVGLVLSTELDKDFASSLFFGLVRLSNNTLKKL
ncbi:hypothetical protein HPB51_007063 [Rhipicephalus microplus]|uniref:C2H2-type domain-containing protein n=1 Tax=Rhipicephalus microplus TaxID=6941 RepID=A0A9J6E083_RHIMP|nr:hypothetical protein HPB51_007063 [Rhipicephalus microplus]